MILTGKVKEVYRDYRSKKPIISLLINEEPHGIDALDEKDLKITITRASSPRSLTSNAYFHKLCGELAKKNKVSTAHQKNDLIAEFGQEEIIYDEPVKVLMNVPPHIVCEADEPHLKYIGMQDLGEYWYIQMRGSHTYSVAEMNELIEGTVHRCIDAGVQTETPEARQHMLMLWEQELLRREKRNDNSQET